MRTRCQAGVALAIVVFALFVLGLLSSTAVVLSFGEHKVDRKFVRHQQASAAADAGAYAPLEQWDTDRYNRLTIGRSVSFQGHLHDGTGSYVGSVTRLGARIFLVTSEGISNDSSVRKRVGAIMRLRPLTMTIDAALDIRGPLDIGQAVRIVGVDRSPPMWNCPPTTLVLPAVRYPALDPNIPPWQGCAASQCLEGNPLWVADTSVVGAAGLDLGGATIDDLKAVALHSIVGGVARPQPTETNGICVTADTYNWGNPYDPTGACGDHFPAVYSEGDLHVSSGQGQGILIVDGDLTVSDGFHYFGVVIVLGDFNSVGVGSQITGAVIVANEEFGPQSLDGMTRIQYSNCAVSRSLAGSGRGVLLRERSWLDLY